MKPLKPIIAIGALGCAVASIAVPRQIDTAAASTPTATPSPLSTLSPSPVATTQPTPVPTPSASPQLVLKQQILWGYTYAADKLPATNWLQLDKSIPYELVDINGICVGRAFAGRIYLRHNSPQLCEPSTAPAATVGGVGNAI